MMLLISYPSLLCEGMMHARSSFERACHPARNAVNKRAIDYRSKPLANGGKKLLVNRLITRYHSFHD